MVYNDGLAHFSLQAMFPPWYNYTRLCLGVVFHNVSSQLRLPRFCFIGFRGFPCQMSSNVPFFMSSFQPPLPQLCQELFALAVEERDPEGIHSLALLGLQVQDRNLVPKTQRLFQDFQDVSRTHENI